MKYILYVYEQGQLPGLEVWGALGVKLQVLQLRAWFPGQTFRHNMIAQVLEYKFHTPRTISSNLH